MRLEATDAPLAEPVDGGARLSALAGVLRAKPRDEPRRER
jgi:hypothetical protein